MTSTTANNSAIRAFRPLIIVFIVLNAGLFGARSFLAKHNISVEVLLVGNLILFMATAVSFYFYYKSLFNNRAPAMVRMIYVGMFVKLALCLFSSFLYIMIAGKEVNKGGIIGCMAIYLWYTILEVVVLLKVSKQKKNV